MKIGYSRTLPYNKNIVLGALIQFLTLRTNGIILTTPSCPLLLALFFQLYIGATPINPFDLGPMMQAAIRFQFGFYLEIHLMTRPNVSPCTRIDQITTM